MLVQAVAERDAAVSAAKKQVTNLQREIGERDAALAKAAALPLATLPSIGIALRPVDGAGLRHLAAALRDLPLPVIGRIEDGALLLDLRCLEEPAKLTGALRQLRLGASP